jgi:hypothetical protein
MRSLQSFRTILSLSLVAIAAMGCGGAGFDPQEKIKTLRVIALQKDKPYPDPGDQVNLKLLYWDGKAQEGSPRKLDIVAYGCSNPKGDLYFNCGERLLTEGGFSIKDLDSTVNEEGGTEAPPPDGAPTDGDPGDASIADSSDFPDGTGSFEAAANEGGGLLPYEADHIKRFTFTVPQVDHLQQPIIRPRGPGGTYGLLYVLFAVCAGTLEFPAPEATNGLGIACRDDQNGLLGSADFVPGYSSLYVYGDRHNKNPEIRDFLFDQKSLQGSPGKSNGEVPHVPRCTGGSCPTYDLKLNLDQVANQEEDPGSIGRQGEVLQEQMWLAFYTTGGAFDHPLRLVNDASQGWNEDNGSKFTAPAEPGPLRIWGVVHDNRGGVAWAEAKIIVD